MAVELNKRLDKIEEELSNLHDWKIAADSEKSTRKGFYQILVRVGPWLFGLVAMIVEYKLLKR